MEREVAQDMGLAIDCVGFVVGMIGLGFRGAFRRIATWIYLLCIPFAVVWFFNGAGIAKLDYWLGRRIIWGFIIAVSFALNFAVKLLLKNGKWALPSLDVFFVILSINCCMYFLGFLWVAAYFYLGIPM